MVKDIISPNFRFLLLPVCLKTGRNRNNKFKLDRVLYHCKCWNTRDFFVSLFTKFKQKPKHFVHRPPTFKLHHPSQLYFFFLRTYIFFFWRCYFYLLITVTILFSCTLSELLDVHDIFYHVLHIRPSYFFSVLIIVWSFFVMMIINFLKPIVKRSLIARLLSWFPRSARVLVIVLYPDSWCGQSVIPT